tara:strand:+ start:189 stop:323 length:135 start_codon:yes stop_codon:yes gene_type:complete
MVIPRRKISRIQISIALDVFLIFLGLELGDAIIVMLLFGKIPQR